MFRSMHRWRPRHLLAAWTTWWVGLAGVTLWKPVTTALRISETKGNQLSASASVNSLSSTVDVTMIEQGQTVWASSVLLAEIVFWIVVPPLAIWGLWIWRRRAHVAQQAAMGSGVADAECGGAAG